jgi:ketosteroid isomerase-like protein
MAADQVSTVQHLYAAFGRGDVDTIIEGLTPDVQWASNGERAAYPTFGRSHGHEEVREFFAHLAGELAFEEFSPQAFCPSGERVFVLGHSRMKVKRTGKPVEMDWVHVFTFRGDKVCGFHDFVDTHQIVEANRP